MLFRSVKLTSIARLSVYSEPRALFGGPKTIELEYAKQVEHARKHGHWFPEPMGVLPPRGA